ncbi:nucleotide-binding domain containing protein [Halovulum sp. GXIMD14794]
MLQALDTAPAGAILVGARGLCQALAERSGLPHVPARADLPPPLCVTVGSTDPITLAQIARLRSGGHVAYLPCPGGNGEGGAIPAQCDIVLIQATDGTEARPDVVARNLANTAAPILHSCRSMVLTGGATAESVLDRLGLATLRVLGEALPGMPLCEAGDQVVVTKSGGFGETDALLRLARLAAEVES